MSASLVNRPRLAAATAVAIVVAVAVVAALFSNSVPDTGLPPRYANEPYGRQFVAINATERGEQRPLAHSPPTFSFGFGDGIGIFTGCNDLSARFKLKDGRLVVLGGGITLMGCSSFPSPLARQSEAGAGSADSWMSKFLDHHPEWRLEGNTLRLSSDFGTMTLLDKGDGRDPEDILGRRFFIGAPSDTRLGIMGTRRFLPNVWAWISISPDGRIQASFACQRVEADAEVGQGTLEVTHEISPRSQPCSARMKGQETEWFWELLRQPLRWRHSQGYLTLASGTDQLTLTDGVEPSVRMHPDHLRNKAFRSIAIEGPGTEDLGIDDGRGVTLEIDGDGNVTAGVGCDRPTVRAEAREAWLRPLPAEVARDGCTNPVAEEWLANFVADEPHWRLTRGRLVIRSGATRMELLPTEGGN